MSMSGLQRISRRSGAFLAAQKRRIVSLGQVGAAGLIASFASLAALGFNTRTLGVEELGVFMAIQAFTSLCAALSSPETWQTVCRLGCEPDMKLERLCCKAAMLDAGMAIAAFILALAGISVAGQVIGLRPEHQHLAAIFAASLLAGLGGTPKGYFRLRGRFGILAANMLLNAALSLAAAVLLWLWQAPLVVFVWTYAAIAVVYKLQLFAQMWLALAGDRRAREGAREPSLREIARISLGASVLTTLAASRKNIATLLVSALAGAAAAGIFAAALKFTMPIAKLAELLRQVVFANVIRAFREPFLPADRIARLRLVVLAMFATMLAGGAVLALLGGPLVGIALDPAYLAVGPVLAVLVMAESAQVAGIVLNPVFQARGRTNLLSAIQAGALALCVLAALALGSRADAMGMAWLLLASSGLLFLAQYVAAFAPRGMLAQSEEA